MSQFLTQGAVQQLLLPYAPNQPALTVQVTKLFEIPPCPNTLCLILSDGSQNSIQAILGPQLNNFQRQMFQPGQCIQVTAHMPFSIQGYNIAVCLLNALVIRPQRAQRALNPSQPPTCIPPTINNTSSVNTQQQCHNPMMANNQSSTAPVPTAEAKTSALSPSNLIAQVDQVFKKHEGNKAVNFEALLQALEAEYVYPLDEWQTRLAQERFSALARETAARQTNASLQSRLQQQIANEQTMTKHYRKALQTQIRRQKAAQEECQTLRQSVASLQSQLEKKSANECQQLRQQITSINKNSAELRQQYQSTKGQLEVSQTNLEQALDTIHQEITSGKQTRSLEERRKSVSTWAEGLPAAKRQKFQYSPPTEQELTCVACQTNQPNVVIDRCLHACLCETCFEEWVARDPTCPICRGPIRKMVKVRFA